MKDETAALDYIKSAIVLDCAEELTSNDGHALADEEIRVVNARLLMKCKSQLDISMTKNMMTILNFF